MINKAELRADIKQALDQNSDVEINPARGREQTANELADAIVKQLLKIQITYTSGLVSPPSGGPVTGILNHTVS